MERTTKSGAAHDEYPIGTANGFLALAVALLLLVAGGLLIASSISSMAFGGACSRRASCC